MTTQATPARSWAGRLRAVGVASEEQWTTPDVRRRLQLALAGVWLLDAVLQFQTFMFSKGFAQLLGGAAQGNPAVIADPISWSARLVGTHDALANALFASVQLLIALGIAFGPTTRLGLGASICWALAVWWLGEGLGGILAGTASPANGAPGAALLYALLAVLLWPSRRERPGPFVAVRCTGAAAARLVWLALWGSLAWLAVHVAARAPQRLGRVISGMAAGQPGWLAGLDGRLGAALSHRGLIAAIVLAIVLALVAVGVYLPRPYHRAAVVLAVGTAAVLWLAQGLGGIATGVGTDLNSGPLLALLAVAYWPLASGAAQARELGTRQLAAGQAAGVAGR